jgi:hypothetical protein
MQGSLVPHTDLLYCWLWQDHHGSVQQQQQQQQYGFKRWHSIH